MLRQHLERNLAHRLGILRDFGDRIDRPRALQHLEASGWDKPATEASSML